MKKTVDQLLKNITVSVFRELFGVAFTVKHSGKMSGMISLSTSTLKNKYCAAYSKIENSICSHCYAQQMLEYRKTAADLFANNYDVLTKKIIPVEFWPVLNCSIARFEAFGDLANETQFINYINCAERNPHCTFSIWTKNPFICKRVFAAGHKKPKNMIIILSSLFVDIPADPRPFPFVDKVFTVYSKDHAIKNNVNINCGARCCLTCSRCYQKNNSGIEYVNEILKQESTKYYKELEKRAANA